MDASSKGQLREGFWHSPEHCWTLSLNPNPLSYVDRVWAAQAPVGARWVSAFKEVCSALSINGGFFPSSPLAGLAPQRSLLTAAPTGDLGHDLPGAHYWLFYGQGSQVQKEKRAAEDGSVR